VIAQGELESLSLHINEVRTIKEFVTNRELLLPPTTFEVIDLMKNHAELTAVELMAQAEFLDAKILENQEKEWPGIGQILKREVRHEKDATEY
jgi:hypothetical protein